MEENKNTKGRICVTGGTGFLGSWIVKRLLEDGYYVNTTARIDPGRNRDLSYLTNLPSASERLEIFNADLDNPERFAAAIKGCDGVFHTAHPMDLDEKEPEEAKIKRLVKGTLCILQACVDAKTVKRVVYTSSLTTALFGSLKPQDENCWSDLDYVRSLSAFIGPVLVSYVVTKTNVEKSAFEFAEKNGLDFVSILPTWITGPFISPNVPDTVHISMALILGDKKRYSILKSTTLVHVDDVARAHIHLFEHPNTKGRYFCAGVETSIEEISELISAKYPEYQMPTPDSWKDLIPLKVSGVTSKKLLETGFKYENGLEEMYDGAIKCCKEKGRL